MAWGFVTSLLGLLFPYLCPRAPLASVGTPEESELQGSREPWPGASTTPRPRLLHTSAALFKQQPGNVASWPFTGRLCCPLVLQMGRWGPAGGDFPEEARAVDGALGLLSGDLGCPRASAHKQVSLWASVPHLHDGHMDCL